MSRPYKNARVLRSAEVTTPEGVRVVMTHHRWDTSKAAVSRSEWVTHERYVDGKRTHYTGERFTGSRLDVLRREWDKSIKIMKEAGDTSEHTCEDVDTAAYAPVKRRPQRRTQASPFEVALVATFPRRRPVH